MGFTPTTITSVQALFAIEREVREKSTNVIKQASPFLYALMGMNEPFVTPIPKRQGRTMPLSGNYHETRFMTEFVTLTTVTDNTDAMSAVTPAVTSPGAAMRVKSTLYSYTHWISDLDLFAVEGADIQKGERFVSEEVKRIQASIERELATALYSGNNQSRSTLSGLELWVDEASVLGIDGYTIDRSLAANAAARSYVASLSAAISELAYFKAKAASSRYGGSTDVALMDYITYSALHDVLDSKDQVVLSNDPWVNYGGEFFKYGKTVNALDAYAPAAKIYGVHLDAVEWGMNKDGITPTSFKDDLRIKAGKAAKVQVGAVLIVPDPRKCWKIEDITFS